MRFAVFLAILSMIAGLPAFAQDRDAIGVGRLFNNDYLGDGRDRWRTGGYVYSHVRAPRAYDANSDFAFGELLEYRLRGEIIAADPRLSDAVGDRPYAGTLSFGVHTHFENGPERVSLGADVVAVGPQTGMSRFQERFHESLDMPQPVFTDTQIGNSLHLQGTASIGRTYHINETVSVRPFIAAQIGVENMIRVGGDVVLGAVGQNDLMLRDVTTGQLYRGTESRETGLSYVLGADFAAVGDSIFLPEDSGVIASNNRTRVRAGIYYQHREGVSFFYGATYLSEEYEGQPAGQIVGSLKLNFNF